MAIDQLYLDSIAATVADLYRGVESAVNRAIAARLKDGLGTTYQQDKSDALAKLRRSAQTILGVLNANAATTIRQAIAGAYADGFGNALADLPKSWFPKSGIGQGAGAAKEVLPNAATIEAIAKAVHQDLGAVSANILRDVQDAYRAVQAESAARIASGAFTRRQAAQAVWQRLVDQGVTSFTDKANRRWQLSSYAEMVTRTNAARAAIEAQNHRLLGTGINLVYVSDVTQECPLCRPFEGRVLSIDGVTTGQVQMQHATRDEEMVTVDVVATLRAAQEAGLHHPNCRHSVSAYLPGVTRLPKQPTADPDGDKARQRQREIERNIRRYKARAEAALTPEARKQAEARAREWQREMRDHLAANPQLKRLRYREAIGAGNVPNSRGPAGGPVSNLAPAGQLDIAGDATPLLSNPPTLDGESRAEQVVPGQLTLADITPERPKPAPEPEPPPPAPGEVTLARLLDHHDALSYAPLYERLVNLEGSDDERAEWAAAVKLFDELADKGETSKSHQKFAGKLALSDDPQATTNRRLGQVKDPALRAAALRALERELAARAARPRPPGMRQGVRHYANDEGVAWIHSEMPLPKFNRGEEYDAIKTYSSNAYDRINTALRNPPPTGSTKDLIDLIDAGMQQTHVPEAVIVHRGVGGPYKHTLGVEPNDEAGMRALVGQVRKESGYLSTSVGERAAFSGLYYLMLRVPAGHEAVNMIPLSHYPHERELMLRRDTEYVIHDVYRRDGAWYIEAEVVPDGWTPGPDWTPDPYGDAYLGY
ncbi:hypothetical protein ITP53_11325 [Nonomuraea sp. K274]|uniref:ADP ribosyltransferase domain-containing protein n=1 Tax=Nonomuraea cypriaca TaxID=1187855 RepID=A0A931AA63_9ACTN|nr:phage minor capsid protein [Nonomuraea cypriaca]MBF8186329.1 hypothetical protein [Nonomuraea cypriaca]